MIGILVSAFIMRAVYTSFMDDGGLRKVGIALPAASIKAEVAEDVQSRNLGLGGRTDLADDRGMLFIFESPSKHPFWMKDMNFPIDMVWIGEDKVVKAVHSDVSTSSYPDLFTPPEPVMYVLELSAGKAERSGIATGTMIRF